MRINKKVNLRGIAACSLVLTLSGYAIAATDDDGQEPVREDAVDPIRVILDEDAEKLPFVGAVLRSAMSMVDASEERVLVVPLSQMNAKQLQAVSEDMQIMSRVLVKRLQQVDMLATRLQRRLPWAGDGIHALYLEGYGALFAMETDLPLSPAVKPVDDGGAESVDRLWEQTKREMFASEGPSTLR